MLEPAVAVPAQFEQTVRRVRKYLGQTPQAELMNAYNLFIEKLNAGVALDDLVDLGDELADTFDKVRRG